MVDHFIIQTVAMLARKIACHLVLLERVRVALNKPADYRRAAVEQKPRNGFIGHFAKPFTG